MIIIRAVKMSDIEAVLHCAITSGIGMTHLPKQKSNLQKILEESMASFSKPISSPAAEKYFFILTDHLTNEIGGTCAIYAKTGTPIPFAVLHLDYLTLPPKEKRLLIPKFYENGPSEICALYLLPSHRKGRQGKLLSLSRFLFIAAFRERFDEWMIANMRGVIDNNLSPFWEGVGLKLSNMSFEEVMTLRINNEKIVSDILPKHPIYAALLPHATQLVIGEVHTHTKPAFNMLIEEGFRFNHEIDPIDGGPLLQCETHNIHTIRTSSIAKIAAIKDSLKTDHPFLISNERLDFRACQASLELADEQVIVNAETADALQVSIGDTIRYYDPFH